MDLIPMDQEHNNEKLAEISSVYANSALIEQSVWDVKLLFGQLVRAGSGKFDVDWHTEVTMPWPQVKLFSYYLQANLALYEAYNGTIRLPSSLHPVALVSDPESTPPEDAAANAKIERLRKDFVDGMK